MLGNPHCHFKQANNCEKFPFFRNSRRLRGVPFAVSSRRVGHVMSRRVSIASQGGDGRVNCLYSV